MGIEGTFWLAIVLSCIGFLLTLPDDWKGAKAVGFAFLVIGFVILGAHFHAKGAVGLSVAIDRNETYVLMGAPIDSLAYPGRKVITVHSVSGGDQSFAVGKFPPAGFVVEKTDKGKTLLVPDEGKK